MRPQVLFGRLLKLLAPEERRGIINIDGNNYYIDPFSNLGSELLLNDQYEADVVDIFKNEIPDGGVVIDIGANEGFFSVIAAQAAGTDGKVISVEPQSRLQDIVRINLALNGFKDSTLYPNAISLTSHETVKLSLFPSSNTGASSIVNKTKLSTAFDIVETITMADIIKNEALERVDFIKIDVEGFEYEVIHSMLPEMKEGIVKKILIDYHKPLLLNRNISPEDLHQTILDTGFKTIIEPDLGYTGYGLYEFNA